MAIGANTLAEILIDLGACDGLNPKNCAQATLKMVALGEKGKVFAARIMGNEFEVFKQQWRTAFERWMEEGGEKVDTGKKSSGLWGDADTEIE